MKQLARLLPVLLIQLAGCNQSVPSTDSSNIESVDEKPLFSSGKIELRLFELLDAANEAAGNQKSRFKRMIQVDNVESYRDSQSPLVLTTMGNDGQFEVIELICPLTDLLSSELKQPEDVFPRFSRVAESIGNKIDPGLDRVVRSLVQDNIEKALTQDQGAAARYRGLVIQFGKRKIDGIYFGYFTFAVVD